MNIIARENIPQEVLDDISQHYETMTWDNYGNPVTENVFSKSSNYRKIIAENTECVVLDSKTFEPKTVIGTQQEGYIVRGIFSDNDCDVYAVISSGIAVRPNDE